MIYLITLGYLLVGLVLTALLDRYTTQYFEEGYYPGDYSIPKIAVYVTLWPAVLPIYLLVVLLQYIYRAISGKQ